MRLPHFDGACDSDCSLREAIDVANRTAGRAEIHLASGVYSVTIPTLTDEEGDTIDEGANALGDLDIADDLVLTGRGAGSTIIAGRGATYRFGGGADRLFDILAHAHVTIADLTIQQGRVSEKGGGLSNSGVLALNRVHLVDNQAASGFKIGHGGGIFNDGTLRLTNSLIADNLGSDCEGETADNVPFSGQRVTSFGHNLDSDGACLPEGVRQPSDLPNGNANLGPLTDNGGVTFAHALLPGSQALDAGDDAVCASEPVAGVDQRGIARPQGTQCDIGAYEAVAQPVTTELLFVSSRKAHQR